MRKRLAKIALFIFSTLGFFTAMAWILLNNPLFQNYVSRYLTTFFRDELHTRFEIGKVHYTLFNKLEFERVYLEDQHGDTLLYAGKLTAGFSLIDLARQHVVLQWAKLDEADFQVASYPGVKGMNIDFLIDYFNPPKPKDPKRPKSPPWIVDIRSVDLTRSIIRYDDFTKAPDTSGVFDYNHIAFLDFNGKLDRLRLVDDSLNARVQSLSTKEKSGLDITHFEGNLTVSPHLLMVEKLLAKTPHSIVQDRLVCRYNNWDELADFVDKVNLEIQLKNSTVALPDLVCFSHAIDGMNQTFQVNGQITGRVPSLKSKNFDIGYGSMTHLAGAMKIKGLPDVDEMYLDIEIRDAMTNQEDLSALLQTEDLPKEFKQLGEIKFTGNFNGFITDFVTTGTFQTDCGVIVSDLNMKLPTGTGEKATYDGKLNLDQFDVGRLYSRPDLFGALTMQANVSGEGFEFKTMKAKVNANVDQMGFYGYTYQHVSVEANLKEKTILGKLAVNDPNFKLTFDGLVDLHPRRPQYQFTSNITDLHLKPLGFDTTESLISLTAKADIAIKDIDDIDGTVDFTNLKIKRLGHTRQFNHLLFTGSSALNNHYLDLKSDFIDANVRGQYSIAHLGDALQGFINHFLPDFMKAPLDKSPEDFALSIHLKDGNAVHQLLLPKFNTTGILASGHFSTSDENLQVNLTSDFMQYDAMEFYGISLETNKENSGAFRLRNRFNRFKVSDSLDFTGVQLDATLKNDLSQFDLILGDTVHKSSAHLTGIAAFATDSISVSFGQSRVRLRDYAYSINPSSKLSYSHGLLMLDNAQLMSDQGRLVMNGIIGPNANHELTMRLLHVDLGVVNTLAATVDGGIGGTLNGVVYARQITSKPIITADIDIQGARVGADTLGFVHLKTNYDEHIEVLSLNGSIEGGQLKGSTLGGHIALNDAANALNLSLKIPGTPLSFFEKFASDLISETEGLATINLDIKGPTSEPVITGSVFLDAAGFTVNYLKTHYRFNQTIELKKDEIDLGKFYLNDKNNHTALLQGKVYHKGFTNYVLDISLTKAKNFCLLGTGPKDNTLFYGDAYASGSARFTGTIDNLQMDIDLASEKGTTLYIPLSNPDEATSANFIRFIQKNNGKKTTVKRKVDFSGIQMNFNLEMTPDAQVQLLFDPALGDVIKGRGRGNIRLEINTRGDFNMYGQYTIDQGDYNFTALNVYQKKFILKPGGTITWDGNPFTARMNIDAVYKLKAAPADLLGTSSSTSTTSPGPSGRVPVECNLYLKGLLLSPDIKFGINIPSVESQNTDNNTQLVAVLEQLKNDPDEMNRQIFSLLILNRFLARQGGGPSQVSPTSGLGAGSLNTTLSDLISAQLSQWLSQIDPNWQLNVRYQTGDDIRTKEWIFQLQRSFFNDRLVVDGSYGIETQAANFNASYMLTPDGRFRIRAFSRSTSNPIQTQNQYYTHGMGFYFRKEFEYLFPDNSKRKKY